MDIVFLIGRILFGGYFVLTGISHFSHLSQVTAYTRAKGVPYAGPVVLLSGPLLLLGGLSVLLGLWPWLGVALLLIYLVPVSGRIHNFWALDDPEERTFELVNFMKNTGLAGAALMILAAPTPWPYSLG